MTIYQYLSMQFLLEKLSQNITNFCNIKSVSDKDLGMYVDSLKRRI